MTHRLAKICQLLPFALLLALLLGSCEKKSAPQSAQVEAAEQTAQTEQITESEQTAENRAAFDELRDGNPDRFYEFNTKTGEAHFSDFYWD